MGVYQVISLRATIFINIMKLRTKAVLFFGTFLVLIALVVVFYAQYIVGDVFKKQTTESLRIIAEQTEGAYLAFEEILKTHVIDLSSDTMLQNIARATIDARGGTPERARLAEEFSTYLKEKKMPFDRTMFLADLLDKNGTVIASTDFSRIGTNEAQEEFSHNANQFSKAIVSKSPEAFVNINVLEEDEMSEPMTHAVARIFIPKEQGEFQAVDGAILFHFSNNDQIVKVLSGEIYTQGRKTSSGFLTSFKTSDIYLVNNERVMMTPSRYVKDQKVNQKVDTLPVRECLEHGKEINEEYDNYKGVRVLGVSMCLKESEIVMVLEIQKDEIFAPLNMFMQKTIIGLSIIAVFGLFILVIFLRWPIARINDVVSALERVMGGDFSAQVAVRARDETGRLATMFNAMVKTIRDTQKDLQKSSQVVEEKTLLLTKEIEEHKEQGIFLEDSKSAMLNILEDTKEVKDSLAVESTRLRTIISSIGDSLILIDVNYRIALVNPKAVELFAKPESELIGKDLRSEMKLLNKKTGELSLAEWPIEEMFLTKKIVTTTLEDGLSLLTNNRTTDIPVAFSIAPLDGGISGGVIIIRDVTRDRLLDESKSGFISVASHQLRTPLTTIRWYSEMLLSGDVGPVSDSQREFLEEIHGGAERLYQTIDLLLGISRIESGKMKPEPAPVNLMIISEEIVHEITPQLREKKLSIQIIPPKEEIIVTLDVLALRQVLLNLFSNAINYTNEGGIIEALFVKNAGDKEVVYLVRDNGIGIPANQRSNIFSKFFRAENATTKRPDGSGLGLALVKEIVESWGGKVWFESTEGKGTTFFFTIPLQK